MSSSSPSVISVMALFVVVLTVVVVDHPSTAFISKPSFFTSKSSTAQPQAQHRTPAVSSFIPSSAAVVAPRSSTLLNSDAETIASNGEQKEEEEVEDAVVSSAVSETVEIGVVDEHTSVDSAADAADADTPEDKRQEHPERTLYMGNFAFATTPEDIRRLVAEQVGGEDVVTIESISMPPHATLVNEMTGTKLSKGFGFVQLSSEDQVDKVIEALNDFELDGRKIRVNKMKSKEEVSSERAARVKSFVPEGQKKLYIGNLSYQATEDDLAALFGEYGTASDIYIPQKDGRRRGFGFITMPEAEADKAMANLDGIEFFDRKLIVNEPLKSGEKLSRPRDRRSKQFKMYVGNLSFFTTKETLQDIFEEFGQVYDCYLPLDPETGRLRGFGFITMEREGGEKAIAALDGMELDERIIRVNEAQGKRRTAPEMKEEQDAMATADYEENDDDA